MDILKATEFEKELAVEQKPSKQALWQAKQRELGNCVICGKKPPHKKCLCPGCSVKRREYQRRRFGYNPKQQGKAGRNIIYHEL
ncbi:MAG: hypothetical protein BroJett002_37220 [Candidatus Brocadia sinica]|nr:MAG: hypothetical protein BroJett002_37220 [Candidatus Brocadia sinica]